MHLVTTAFRIIQEYLGLLTVVFIIDQGPQAWQHPEHEKLLLASIGEWWWYHLTSLPRYVASFLGLVKFAYSPKWCKILRRQEHDSTSFRFTRPLRIFVLPIRKWQIVMVIPSPYHPCVVDLPRFGLCFGFSCRQIYLTWMVWDQT